MWELVWPLLGSRTHHKISKPISPHSVGLFIVQSGEQFSVLASLSFEPTILGKRRGLIDASLALACTESTGQSGGLRRQLSAVRVNGT